MCNTLGATACSRARRDEMKPKRVHVSIKERLGYPASVPDAEFLADWKKRSRQVCKPCWELKYCPYGPFVEQSPLLPSIRSDAVGHIQYLRDCRESGMIGERGTLDDERRQLYTALLERHDTDPGSFQAYVAQQLRWRSMAKDPALLGSILDPAPLPPINRLRVPFDFDGTPNVEEELPDGLELAVDAEARRLRESLETGQFDEQRPLDDVRRRLFQEEVDSFRPEDHPEEIPEEVAGLACNFFGHICPVAFVAENVGESTEERRRGRYIPFTTKMRVVRRDNYTCQECGVHLRDDEVEFDHIIPASKGGSSEEHNLRLTCFDCNREKSNRVTL